jgi:predicted amidohydrolase
MFEKETINTQNHMSALLKVALIQLDIAWENPKANRITLEKKIQKLPSDVDLIILPEMFTTGFTKNAKENYETMDGETVLWLQTLAGQKNMAITGSIIVQIFIEKAYVYVNRLLFAHPSGSIDFYDKKHTFTYAGEDKTYLSGKKKTIINYKEWKICPLICYDLRFPVWSRNTENYDLLLYVASWPKARITAWDTLLKARAIENMSYTIGVNRVGTDAYLYEYSGNSAGYDALGNCLGKNDLGEETTLLLELNKKEQNTLRNKFGFLQDKDDFRLF